MIKALEVDSGMDLRPFLTELHRHGIRHQVSEESGQQVIWVNSDQEAAQAVALLEQWRYSGFANLHAEQAQTSNLQTYLPVKGLLNNLWASFYRAPVTVVLIIACLLVAFFSRLGAELQSVGFLFYPVFNLSGDMPVLGLPAQIDSISTALRTLTPALLHFGAIHLVFNLLWLWYFGSMIEALQPSWRYALIVVFLAFVSNTAQYFSAYSANFGGMSGVVYGLLGYIWIWQMLFPRSRLRLPAAMITVFLVALVLMEVFASSWIATAAHVGGVVSGMVAAAAVALMVKMTGAREL
jgi:GlpG protein